MQARAKETRVAVMTAAGKMFSDLGYENASLALICSQVEVTSGALYFHFPSKEALARAVLERFHQRMGEFCETLLQRDGPSLDTMVFASVRWGRLIVSDPIVAGGVRLSVEKPDLLSAEAVAYDPWVATTAELLSRARRAGEVDVAIDITSATRFLIGAFVGTQLLSRVFTKHADFEERLVDLWRFTLTGLLPRREGVGDLVSRALREAEAQTERPLLDAPPATPQRSG